MAEVGDASQEEVKELTNQFYVTLRAYAARLDKEAEARSPESFRQVEELLKDGRPTWSDAYQIEQLLVELFDERSLEVELQSRLLEAQSILGPALAAQYVKLASAMKTPVERRPLLARLVNDLQWRYTVNEVKRTYSKEITKTTGLIFIVTIGLFAVAVIVRLALETWIIGKPASVATDAALLFLAGLAGGWGAGFSMVASLKGRLDAADLNDLKLLKSKWILWSRPLIGVGAACILYFFLVAGLLSGAVFPKLNPEQARSTSGQSATVPASPATADSKSAPAGGKAPVPTHPSRDDVAMLVVWCFVAGFSERLVPALLAKTENRMVGQSSLGSDRFKPSLADAGGAGPSSGEGRGPEKRESRPSDRTPRPSVQTPREPPKTA